MGFFFRLFGHRKSKIIWRSPQRYRPPRSKARAGQAHGYNRKWENYTIANQSPAMREYLYQRQKGICLVCGQPLNKRYMQIHHTTYDHECYTGKSCVAKFRDYSGKMRPIQCPPCDVCRRIHPMRFRQCSAHLIAVHARCHMKIHGIKREEHKS